jgi:2-oxo-4-hydroxy-4-carboxy-5-ureidoimidazoline decarboxylase
MTKLTQAEANALSDAEFVATFGYLFEHSPWVVQRAAGHRPFGDLHAGLMQPVYAATEDERLALIRAHPELAGKAAIAGELTAESSAEQASVGLDRLSTDEFERFHALNTAYGARFGFPFIICVRLTNKAGILAAMERRLTNQRSAELATAIDEIGKIVKLRLNEVLGA